SLPSSDRIASVRDTFLSWSSSSAAPMGSRYRLTLAFSACATSNARSSESTPTMIWPGTWAAKSLSFIPGAGKLGVSPATTRVPPPARGATPERPPKQPVINTARTSRPASKAAGRMRFSVTVSHSSSFEGELSSPRSLLRIRRRHEDELTVGRAAVAVILGQARARERDSTGPRPVHGAGHDIHHVPLVHRSRPQRHARSVEVVEDFRLVDQVLEIPGIEAELTVGHTGDAGHEAVEHVHVGADVRVSPLQRRLQRHVRRVVGRRDQIHFQPVQRDGVDRFAPRTRLAVRADGTHPVVNALTGPQLGAHIQIRLSEQVPDLCDGLPAT